MPPALDRLLASPSALRLLRSIVESPELPLCTLNSHRCGSFTTPVRKYSSDTKTPTRKEWARWGRDYKYDTNCEIKHILPRDHHECAAQTPGAAVEDKNDVSKDWNRFTVSGWARTLSRIQRVQGRDGVKKSWRLCRSRNWSLPTKETPDAAFIWGTYLKDSDLVPEVIDYASELLRDKGRTFQPLYKLLMCYWLPRKPAAAWDYHNLMLEKLEMEKIPLKEIIQSIRYRPRPATMRVLIQIYRLTDERDLYDEVVLSMIERSDLAAARRWHIICIEHNDRPSEALSSNPIVQMLLAEDSSRNSRSPHQRKSTGSKGQDPKYDHTLLKRLSGRDSAPVRFDDSFCARMFATQTFPPASIISGLAMVGVNEIGPLAVQSMALRTDPIEELPRRFQELRESGITLQGCVFSLALEKFALEQKWELVRSLLYSDQHPDVYDDTETQRKLLKFYLEQHDYKQIGRTLAILTLFHKNSDQESYNLLLQMHVDSLNLEEIAKVLQEMRIRGIMVTPESITALKSVLRHRQAGHRPAGTKTVKCDDLRFVARTFICILESGMGYVTPLYWREIIRRFGMLGRIKELKRLLLWLLCWYAPRGIARYSKLPRSPFLDASTLRQQLAYPDQKHYFHFPANVEPHENKSHPINQLFPPALQNAIIIWGFKAGLLPNATLEQSLLGSEFHKRHYRRKLIKQGALQREKWGIGLEIVAQLRDLGVHVRTHVVRKSLQQQLNVLFGSGRSNVIENRVMEEVNSISYSFYTREINHIWGSDLLREPPSIKKTLDIHDQSYHPARSSAADRNIVRYIQSQYPTQATEDLNGTLQQLQQRFDIQAKADAPDLILHDKPLFEDTETAHQTI